jgi:hypothetical protein
MHWNRWTRSRGDNLDPVKRRDLLRYLSSQGCEQLGDGNHSWWWNPAQNRHSLIPRNTENEELLVRKISKDLGLPPP